MTSLTVVFDLDGTMIDTAPDLIGATNHVLDEIGLAAIPGEEIRPFISLGSRRMIQHGLELHRHTVSETELDRMWRKFLDYYADNIAVESRPFPGMEATLDTLVQQGARIAVCTNKQEGMAHRLLLSLGLTDRFAAICGRDTFPVCKPNPGHLTRTIAAAGGRPDRAIMVGDSDVDVATARAAEIPIIGVSFGYSEIPMLELKPDALIDGYDQFAAALASLSKRFGT